MLIPRARTTQRRTQGGRAARAWRLCAGLGLALALTLALPLLAPAAAVAAAAQAPIPPGKIALHDDLPAPRLPVLRHGTAALRPAATGIAQPTLPSMSFTYKIGSTSYSGHQLGTDPFRFAGTTTIPVVIVPVRITVTNYPGGAFVSDGNAAVPGVLASPAFRTNAYARGTLQYVDGLLRTTLTWAPASWHTLLSPSVAATLDVATTTVNASVKATADGSASLLIVNGAATLRPAFLQRLAQYKGNQLVLFVTYNAVDSVYGGYHDATTLPGSGTLVWAYAGWLIGVDSLFTHPFPNAYTITHELAEIAQDPYPGLSPSATLQWGDPFRSNRCTGITMEGGDVIEYAPATTQRSFTTSSGYSVANVATLPWFVRPTTAPFGPWSYSFPDRSVLTSAAPLTCSPF